MSGHPDLGDKAVHYEILHYTDVQAVGIGREGDEIIASYVTRVGRGADVPGIGGCGHLTQTPNETASTQATGPPIPGTFDAACSAVKAVERQPDPDLHQLLLALRVPIFQAALRGESKSNLTAR